MEHDIHEWDNIPPIIVRMCLNLHRYMQSTIGFVAQTHYELRALQHDVSLIPGQFKTLRDEQDVRFADKQRQIEETRDKLPGIYEEIENIKRRMIEEKEKLIESAKESMMSKLTLKN